METATAEAPAPATTTAAAPAQAEAAPAAAQPVNQNQPPPPATPAAAAPKPLDEAAKKRVSSAVDQLEAELGARFYTNDKKVTEALRGKSPEEIAAIRKEYEEKTGQSMDALVKKHVTGKDLEEATALLEGDKGKSASLALQDALKLPTGPLGGGSDMAKVNAVLEDINNIKDKDKRDEALAKMRADYAKATGTSLDDMLKLATNKTLTRDKNNHEMQAALALAHGDKTRAEAVRLDEKLKSGVLGIGKDTEGVQAALAGKSPAEQEALAKAYKDFTGKDLKTAVGDELKGADKAAATAQIEATEAKKTLDDKNATPEQKAAAQKVVDKKEAESSAAKLEASMGTLTDKKALMKQLEMKTKDDNGKPLEGDALEREKTRHKAMIDAYNEKYGKEKGENLDKRLEKELGPGLDLDKARMLAADGKLKDEFALKYALKSGVFTDKEGVKAALKNADGTPKTAEEINALREKYGKEAFDKDLKEHASGSSSDHLEIDQLLRGKAESVQEELERAKEKLAHEHGSDVKIDENGKVVRERGVMDLLSNRGDKLDKQTEKLQAEFERLKAKEARGEEVTEEDKKKFDKVNDFQGRDAKMLADAKSNVAETAAAGAGIAAGTAATFFTGGAAAPALTAILSAGVGTGASMATKLAIKGGNYTGKEAIIDAGTGAAGALTAGAAKHAAVLRALNRGAGVQNTAAVPYQFASGTLKQEFGKGVVTGAAQGAASEGTRAALDEKNHGQGTGRFLLKVGGAALKGAAISGASSGVTGALTYGQGVPGAASSNSAAAEAAIRRNPAALQDVERAVGRDQARQAAIAGAKAGATGGAVNTTVDLAINGTNGMTPLEIAAKYGQGVAGGAISGSADAHATKQKEQAATRAERRGAGGQASGTDEAAIMARANGASVEETRAIRNGNAAAEQVKAAEKVRTEKAIAERAELNVAERTRRLVSPEDPISVPRTAHKDGDIAIQNRLKPEDRAALKSLLPIDAATGKTDLKQMTPERIQELKTRREELRARTAAEREQLRQDSVAAREGGKIDPATGAKLRERAIEARLDHLPPEEALYFHGFDPRKTREVYNSFNNVDAQAPVKNAGPDAKTDAGRKQLREQLEGAFNRDNTRKVNPDELPRERLNQLIDRQAALFDDIHGPRVSGVDGRTIEGTPFRKIIDEAGLTGYGTRGGPAQVGGDIATRGATKGVESAEAVRRVGLDYRYAKNEYITNPLGEHVGLSDLSTKRGVGTVDWNLTSAHDQQLKAQLGPGAARVIEAEAAQRRANGEYIPRLLETGADGKLSNAETRSRTTTDDPKTGWGFTAPERLADPQQRDARANLELRFGRSKFNPLPEGATVNRLSVGKSGYDATPVLKPSQDDATGRPTRYIDPELKQKIDEAR